MFSLFAVSFQFRRTWFQHQKQINSDPNSYLIFDQFVDHFDNTNTTTFKQRYLVNNSLYKENGPLYVFIGGEGALGDQVLNNKYSISYFAEQTHGFMVALEHRYYGESLINKDMADMSMLSSKQAISDLATFIPYIKKQYGLEKSKVIVIGGSYAGNLANWARTQLPFVIDAAIATSGPAMGELKFEKYMRHAQASLKALASPECYSNITTALDYLNALLLSDITAFKEFFELKPDQFVINFGQKDIASAQGYLSDTIIGLIQYHNAAGFDGSDYIGSIPEFCQQFMVNLTDKSTELDIAKAYKVMNPLNDKGNIAYTGLINCMKDISDPDCRDTRSWIWQTCTEFGYYQTNDYQESIWGQKNGLKFSIKACNEVFMQDLIPEGNGDYPETQAIIQQAIDFTNAHFGARNQPRSHIIFTNGRVDPWSELAVVQEKNWADGQYNGENAMFWIENGSHCTDMYLRWKTNDDVRKAQLDKLREWGCV
ncbi:Serine_carboxypeptidase [Hexamita inflata]|uniref:Serine carboxypeptidase n=1 Tax=Hexamita inflata TaxID=28002 RepID=A0AA86QK01_9EUKA|nr:Serine carboxypeptidase [Hexamita inflata]